MKVIERIGVRLSWLVDFLKKGSGLKRPFRALYRPKRETESILLLADAQLATFHLYFDLPIRNRPNKDLGYRLVTHESLKACINWSDQKLFESLFEAETFKAVVFSRFSDPRGATIAQQAKALGLPVYYHIDDDLFSLPESLGSEIVARHGEEASQLGRRKIIELSERILCSTNYLSERIRSLFPTKDIRVGPSLPYAPFGEVSFRRTGPNETFTIGYMGSKGHRRDLAIVEPALIKVLRNHPRVRFETFGSIGVSNALKEEFGDRVAHWPGTASYEEFHLKLQSLSWQLGLAPLIDDRFNNSKTPVKFLELTAAGIPTLASDTVVYREFKDETGILFAIEDWEVSLRSAIEGKMELEEQVARSQRFCRLQFSAAKASESLDNVIN